MDAPALQSFLLRRNQKKFKSLLPEFGEGIHFLELSTALIRYKSIGQGERTIVFIPDAPNVIEHYDKLCDLLRTNFQVVIVELPGFGFSVPKHPSFRFTLREAVHTMIELLDALKLQHNYLCFPCVSGFIALKIAQKRPDLVARIINVQTPTWNEQIKWVKGIDPRGILSTPLIGQSYMYLNKDKIAAGWYQFALPKGNYNSFFMDQYKKVYQRGACYCLASGLQGLFKHKDRPQFPPVEQESLIIWGMKDRSHRKTAKESSQDHFQNGRVIHFEEAGHFPELEYPEKFKELILAF